jgi:anti-anti-sigma factor
MVMEVTSNERGSVVIMQVKGRLDATTAAQFEKECDAWMERGFTAIIADLEQLEYVSSAGLRVILSAAKKLKSRNGQIKICNISGLVREVFALSGFTNILAIYPTVEEALGQADKQSG